MSKFKSQNNQINLTEPVKLKGSSIMYNKLYIIDEDDAEENKENIIENSNLTKKHSFQEVLNADNKSNSSFQNKIKISSNSAFSKINR